MIDERKQEIIVLQQALAVSWGPLSQWLNRCRSVLVAELVRSNNDETRGKIKQLDELLALPEQLQNEARALAAPPQSEGGLLD